MSQTWKLFLDLNNRSLVKGPKTGGGWEPPKLIHTDQILIYLQVLNKNENGGDVVDLYNPLSASGLSAIVTIVSVDKSTELAKQTNFDPDSTGMFLVGTLDLDTSPMFAEVDGEDTISPYLFIRVQGDERSTFKRQIIIERDFTSEGSDTLVSVGSGLSQAQLDQLDARYLKINNDDAVNVTFNNNGHTRVFGLLSDGSPLDSGN